MRGRGVRQEEVLGGPVRQLNPHGDAPEVLLGIHSDRGLVGLEDADRDARLQQVEQLEQLCLLEAGIPIRVLEIDQSTIGVDTEEDLRAVEALLSARAR